MRRLLAATLATAALVGAGATAATAASGVVGVTDASLTAASGPNATQCEVVMRWRPNPYQQVDHYDVRRADSQAGLASAPTVTVRGTEKRWPVNKGTAVYAELTPVLADGTAAIPVTRKIDAVAC